MEDGGVFTEIEFCDQIPNVFRIMIDFVLVYFSGFGLRVFLRASWSVT